jgi:TATA-box binding protein (TBP) (component of TFIID and TFIIIB)
MATRTNTRNYTPDEWDALWHKMDNPNETVLCPRCGNVIIYKEPGNSILIKCLTEGCIFGGVRGL